MAGGPTVMIAFADFAHGEELAFALAEEHGLPVTTPADLDMPEHFDVAVTDGRPFDGRTPWLVVGDEAAGLGDVGQRSPPSGVLPASADTETVAAAIRLLTAGYRLLPAAHEDDGPEREPPRHQPLTPRENEVLALLASGASNKHIARALDISVHTAKFHVAALLAKLEARNRTDAIAIAMREGLLLV
jgi:DNA-binding NarL/FixJ family response regulator